MVFLRVAASSNKGVLQFEFLERLAWGQDYRFSDCALGKKFSQHRVAGP